VRKLVSSFLVGVIFLLAGCSHTGITEPVGETETSSDTSPALPPAPAGMDWYPIMVNGKTYQYAAKDLTDAQ
jgi:hypothetical protein